MSWSAKHFMAAFGRFRLVAVVGRLRPIVDMVQIQSSVSTCWILVHASLFGSADYGTVLRFAPVPI